MKKSPNLCYLSICATLIIFMMIWCGSIYGYLLVYLVSVNLLSMGFYKIDKMISKYEGFRIPENTLLTLGFFGGTIGALIGQQLFRHKTSKKSFQMSFWFLTIIQIGLLLWWVYGR